MTDVVQDLLRTVEIGSHEGKQQEKERDEADEEVESDGGGMVESAITVKFL
jgi:hypothetical protein